MLPEIAFPEALLPWAGILIAVIIFLAALAIGRIIWSISWRIINKILVELETPEEERKRIRRTFRWPITLIVTSIAALIAIPHLNLPSEYAFWVSPLLQAVLVIGAILLIANIFSQFVIVYMIRLGIPRPLTRIANFAIRVVVYIVGAGVFLSVFGLDVYTLAVSFGVIGIGIGLATKEILSDLLAGVGVGINAEIQVGDFIRLSGGQEGRVEAATWRSVKLRTPEGNLLVIPNRKLAADYLTNFSRGKEAPRLLVKIEVKCNREEFGDVFNQLTALIQSFVATDPQTNREAKPLLRISEFGGEKLTLVAEIPLTDYYQYREVLHRFLQRLLESNIPITTVRAI